MVFSLQWNLSQSQTTVELFPLRQGSHHRGCLQTQVLAVWNPNALSPKLTAKKIHLVVGNLPVDLCSHGAQRPMLSVAALVGSSLGAREYGFYPSTHSIEGLRTSVFLTQSSALGYPQKNVLISGYQFQIQQRHHQQASTTLTGQQSKLQLPFHVSHLVQLCVSSNASLGIVFCRIDNQNGVLISLQFF